MFVRGSRPLRHFDQTLGGELAEAMIAQGIHLHTGAQVLELRQETDGVCVVEADHARSATSDAVLWAIGRSPNTQGMGLEKLGVELDTGGFIAVNQFQDTNIPSLHAVGDVTGRVNLTPVAIAAGRLLSDRLFGGKPEAHLSYDDIPSVIFTHPPIGSVGMSEADALDRFGPDAVKVYRSRFSNIYHALKSERPRSVMKLVTVGAEERIVGIHVFGMAADELIQGFAVALRMGATKADLDRTVAIHPTAAEELVTMR